MRPEERYRERYSGAIAKFKKLRDDVTFTEITCLSLRYDSFWVARGSAKMPWGSEPLVFLGIGDNWIVLADPERVTDMLLRFENAFEKELRYAHENADNQRTD
jgi:hypothetical protein